MNEWTNEEKIKWWREQVQSGKKTKEQLRQWIETKKPDGSLKSSLLSIMDNSDTPPKSTEPSSEDSDQSAKKTFTGPGTTSFSYEIEGIPGKLDWKQLNQYAISKGYYGGGGPYWAAAFIKARTKKKVFEIAGMHRHEM